jgi:hypothetical protein
MCASKHYGMLAYTWAMIMYGISTVLSIQTAQQLGELRIHQVVCMTLS